MHLLYCIESSKKLETEGNIVWLPLFFKAYVHEEHRKRGNARLICGKHSEERPWERLAEKEGQQTDGMPASGVATAAAKGSSVMSRQQVAGDNEEGVSRTGARTCQCDKTYKTLVWNFEQRYV